MALVVLGEVPEVSGSTGRAAASEWTISAAEDLLRTLRGVVSVRIVAKPGGRIEEIHLLTSADVNPKQTVRNVESALLAHFDLEVDHRCISVAESHDFGSPRPLPEAEAAAPTGSGPVALVRSSPESRESRILFHGHRVESTRSQEIRMVVTLEWEGECYEGEAAGPDLPRGRLETVAAATLRAIEEAMKKGEVESGGIPGTAGRRATPGLALDGVKLVDAFERSYVLVAVHALTGRDVTTLAGSAVVVDTPDRAVILATLQAADRWVRGRLT